MDYRDLFRAYTQEVNSFGRMAGIHVDHFTHQELDALEDIFEIQFKEADDEFESRDSIKEAEKKGVLVSLRDRGTSYKEFILKKHDGYYYINTEGYDYCRYGFYIEDFERYVIEE